MQVKPKNRRSSKVGRGYTLFKTRTCTVSLLESTFSDGISNTKTDHFVYVAIAADGGCEFYVEWHIQSHNEKVL